jgi:hypothetical protein
MRGRVHFFGVAAVRTDHIGTLAVARELIVAPKPAASRDRKHPNHCCYHAKFESHFRAR